MTQWTRQDLEDHLLDYLYDELEPAQRAAFERAMPQHPEVVREVEAHRATRLAFRGYTRESMPPGLLDELVASVEAGAPVRRPAVRPAPSWWERVRAFAAQPAFAMAFVTLVVAGVGLVASRKGEVPGMPPSTEAQHLPPVAVSGTEKSEIVAKLDAPSKEAHAAASADFEAPADRERGLDDAAQARLDGLVARGDQPSAETLALRLSEDKPKVSGDATELAPREAPPVGAPLDGRDGLGDLSADGKLGRNRGPVKAGLVLAAPEAARAEGAAVGGVVAGEGQQGWFDGDFASKDKVAVAPAKAEPLAKGLAEKEEARAPAAEPKRVAVSEANAPQPDVWAVTGGASRVGSGGAVSSESNENDFAKVVAKPTETRAANADKAPVQANVPQGRYANEVFRGGDDAGRADPTRVEATRTVEAKVAERKATVAIDEEAAKRDAKPAPRLEAPAPADATKTANNSNTPPANATPERLWTLFQQQSAAGAWADAELTVAALAKAEGESARVKQARGELQKRVEAGKKGNNDKLPPDPPAAPNRNTGGK